MKIQMKINLILILLLLSSPLILANTIDDAKITINIYNISKIPKNNTIMNYSINMSVEIINKEYSNNNLNFTFTIFNNSIVSESKEFDFIFIKEDHVESLNLTKTYLDCEKRYTEQFYGWNKCRNDLDDLKEENSTACNEKLNTCNLQLTQKNSDLKNKNTEITTLTTEKEGTKNTKWFYGIIGVVLGIVGLLFKEGRLGQGPKDKAMDEFNKSQAG